MTEPKTLKFRDFYLGSILGGGRFFIRTMDQASKKKSKKIATGKIFSSPLCGPRF